MSNKKTTVVAEAVIEAKEIMEAAKKHMKDLLLSDLEPEINKLVNESLEEKDKSKEEKETAPVTTEASVEDEVEDETADSSDETPSDDVISVDSSTEETPEEESPIASALDGMTSTDEPEVSVDDETSIDSVSDVDTTTDPLSTDDTTVDLTNSPIDDVVKVFKEITPEDQIEVVKDENGISLDVKGEKFFIKLNENESLTEDDDELLYEIELEDEDEVSEEKLDEVSRTHSDGNRMVRKPVGFYNYSKDKLRSALQEDKTVKVDDSKIKELEGKLELAESEKVQLKESLKEVRESLVTMALYNNNLGHAVKLFLEHSITKAEKKEIVTRFNNVNNVTESKNLFESISTELKNKKPISESIAEKIDSTLLGASSDKTLVTEAKDEVLTRMIKLINYNKKEN